MAYEVAAAGKEKNVKRAMVAMPLETVLQLAEQIEELERLSVQIEEAYAEDVPAVNDEIH
jgi:hypothetical protein